MFFHQIYIVLLQLATKEGVHTSILIINRFIDKRWKQKRLYISGACLDVWIKSPSAQEPACHVEERREQENVARPALYTL